MQIANIDGEYFTAVDGCKITELFGIPSNSLQEVSLAYAVLPSGETDEHKHNFLEIYTLVNGKGIMQIDGEKKEISHGESVLIGKGQSHSIKNIGDTDLCFYCICVPAFKVKGTEMKSGVAKESIERNWRK